MLTLKISGRLQHISYGLMLACYLALSTANTVLAQPCHHVVLISIDGFRPDMYLDKSWPTPNLQMLMRRGCYADHMLSVFPAYTYPAHVAMVTGAMPARSGIYFNQPIGSNGEWHWFNDAIKVQTIWQALGKAGMSTASVEWPPSVTNEITYDIPEIWDIRSPADRITAARKFATPGLIEEVEQNATGKLDSNSMNEGYFSLDENAGRAAAYIFKKYQPNFLALHFACVDGVQHDYGREHDSVRLAIASVDRAIGDMLESIQRSGQNDSTAIIITGDHGFSTINSVFRPNMLIPGIPAKFIAAGGSAFLYKKTANQQAPERDVQQIIQAVIKRLDSLPREQRARFRIIDRSELDKMGVDSCAILALAALPGLVFSGATVSAAGTNSGPGTVLQLKQQIGVFTSVTGGHHGYDPNVPDMYTGFIAAGPGINRGTRIRELCVTDIAPLAAFLLGIHFQTPDGVLHREILNTNLLERSFKMRN